LLASLSQLVRRVSLQVEEMPPVVRAVAVHLAVDVAGDVAREAVEDALLVV
jgi:hypothetical protein